MEGMTINVISLMSNTRVIQEWRTITEDESNSPDDKHDTDPTGPASYRVRVQMS